MSGATSKWGLPFPTGGDEVIVHGDVQALAVKVDLELDNAVATVKPKPIDAADNLDSVALLDKVSETGGATDWAAQNYPANVAGVVSTYRLIPGSSADAHAVQMFVSREPIPRLWLRPKTADTWGAWQQIGPGDFPRKVLGAGTDANSLTDVPMNTVAQTAGGTANTPAGVGVLMHYGVNTSTAYGVQMFVSSTNQMWTRYKTANTWGAWVEIGGGKLPAAYGAIDLNTLTRGTRQAHSGAFTNGPTGMDAGMVETTAIQNNDNYLLQTATEWTYPDRPGRIWTRRKSGASWGAWGLIGPTPIPPAPPASGGGNASAYKVVSVPLNGGQTSTSNTSTTMTVRQVIDVTAPITRARLRFRNIDTRSGSTKTTTATVSDVYVGPHIGSGAASSLTKVADGFTVAADEVASAWINLDHDGTSELLITYTVTAAVGGMFTNYGDVYTNNSSAAHTETAPTGLYRTYTTPLAVTMDAQTAPTTPVLAVAGDSNSIGVGSSGIRDAWGWRLAARLGALPQLLGSSGDTVAASRDYTAYKWARCSGDGRAQADTLLWALGQNDLGAGTTSTAIQAMLAEDIPKARALIAPSGVHAITYMPRDNEDPSSAFEVQRRLLNTALKDQRPFGLLDVHDIVPVVSTDDETIRPEYKGGGGGTDPVHLNALGFQAVADSITRPLVPTPA
jgi:lysophospholipase L1-like esterase